MRAFLQPCSVLQSVRSLLTACGAAVLATVAHGQDFQDANIEFPETLAATYHVPVSMRDGTALATDIYLPAAEGRYPTILVRDIYSSGTTGVRQSYAKFATANGYAFVFQSARGRYDSEGDWYPYFQEINDGDDTLTWIAEQPWSDGKVGMLGTSYLGSTQWLAALGGNPALKAIVPAMSPGNYYRDVAYPGGAFSLLSRARWGIGIVGSRTTMMYPINWAESMTHLPLDSLASSLGFDVPHFQDWLDHPAYDDYWGPLNLEQRASEMTVPALNIGGWYDVFLRSTIGSYKTMTEQAASEVARDNQRLLIGPWPHGWNLRTTTGQVDFGEDALIDLVPLYLEWFDHWLKEGPAPTTAPVQIFVMGINEWRGEAEWPLSRTDYQTWYLHGDGTLSKKDPTADAPALRYRYDPADPVPTLGGNIMDPALRGAFDQSALDDREDILRFVSAPFEDATELTGPVSATLYAATDVPDTDFMVKLSVVRRTGEVLNLVDGVIRARYREGFEKEILLEPGQVYRYDIDLWATSYRLAQGERLRVDITSSNFPRLARNLNTGAAFAKTSKFQVANQKIQVSERYPSSVLLPVIPHSNGTKVASGD